MINTRDASLNQTPETLNAIGVDIPPHIDFNSMLNAFMVIGDSSHVVIAGELGN